MKKGHRRTQSETICINKIQEKQKNSKPTLNQQKNIFIPETHLEPINTFDIQTLLKNSQAKIHQRVFLIDNLQKPILNKDQSTPFEFGKRNHLKLKPQNNYYALNMLQIPQEAKSKQSPSIQNDDKISIQDKDTFFTEKPLIQKYSKIDKINQLKNYGIKINNNSLKSNNNNSIQANHKEKINKIKHTYTKSTKIINYKNSSNFTNQKDPTSYNVAHYNKNNLNSNTNKRILIGVREDYQNHKKNALSQYFKPATAITQKQPLNSHDVFGLLKRKKKNFLI